VRRSGRPSRPANKSFIAGQFLFIAKETVFACPEKLEEIE